MKDSVYLIFTSAGVSRMAKGRTHRSQPLKRPALRTGEYAVIVAVTVPESVFKQVPTPRATITIPEATAVDLVITATVEVPATEEMT